MLKRPEFQPCLDNFWVLGQTVTLTKFFSTQECEWVRDVSGQPDKIPAATMEGVANILFFERGLITVIDNNDEKKKPQSS